MATELTKRYRRVMLKSFGSDEEEENVQDNSEASKVGAEETASIFEDTFNTKRKMSTSDEERDNTEETFNALTKKRKVVEDKEKSDETCNLNDQTGVNKNVKNAKVKDKSEEDDKVEDIHEKDAENVKLNDKSQKDDKVEDISQ